MAEMNKLNAIYQDNALLIDCPESQTRTSAAHCSKVCCGYYRGRKELISEGTCVILCSYSPPKFKGGE